MLEIQQQGEAVLTGTAFFGLRRDTRGVDEHTMPATPFKLVGRIKN